MEEDESFYYLIYIFFYCYLRVEKKYYMQRSFFLKMIIAYFGKHSFEEVPTLGIDIAEKVILVKKDFGGCYPISNQFEKRIVIRPLDLQIEFWWDSVDNKEEKLMYSTDYAEVISEKNQLLIYFIKT